MFWLPKGWVPGYVEWVLAFPRSPTGSVSIQVWGVACATAIKLVGAAIEAGWVLFIKEGMKSEGAKQKDPMKMGAGAGVGGGGGGRKGEKKEL